MGRSIGASLSVTELRAVQLQVLTSFDQLCRRNQLTYYLAYGTLLGAVRHQGYIPWDDDIDVMMPRADYQRLSEVFASSAPDGIRLDSPATRRDWPFPYAKVSDPDTELFEPLAEPLALGVNLDVFPLDVLPVSRPRRLVQSVVIGVLRWAVELRYIAVDRGRGWHHPLALMLVKPLLHRIPARVLETAYSRVAQAGGRSSGPVGVRVGSYDWSVAAEALGPPQQVAFEHLRLCAPADPDVVLTAMYGDYAQLPPESDQISHHAFTAVWR